MDAISLKQQMYLDDCDYPDRVSRLQFLSRVRDGKQYDHILNPFSQERDGSGSYLKLDERRPSVQTNLCRTVVQDSVALLFGDGRFPTIQSPDENTSHQLRLLISETRVVDIMNSAAVIGSVGSVVILMRILKGRVFFEIKDTAYLTPAWRPDEPDALANVIERYKIDSSKLKSLGYHVDNEGTYWFERRWTDSAEIWYFPQSLEEANAGTPLIIDESRTVIHELGFVPMIWIRNLPGLDEVDGDCTFEPAISTVIEVDYQLSQAGRGLKYASDPTLLIKEPAMAEGGKLVRSSAEAIVVSKDGDAKLLEIGGTASQAVIEYVRCLRESALESIHGNRTNVDKLNGAQSGRALEMMNQGLVWLADRLRISYGQEGLLPLMRMVCKASQRSPIIINENWIDGLVQGGLSLLWPKFFSPTYAEKLQEAQAYATLLGSGLISQRQAIAKLAADNDVEDIKEETRLIGESSTGDSLITE